jgi:hypothetical protein
MDRRAAAHFLDRPVARWCAVAVFLLSAAALAYIHRDDLLGEMESATRAGSDPLALCMQARSADIQKMQQEGLLKPDQVERTLGQLEPICRAQLNMDQQPSAPAPPPLPQ